MKNSLTERRNTPEGMNSRLEEAEEQISDLEDRVMESNQVNSKKQNKNENRLRELSDIIKHNTICDIEIPEERRRQKTYLKK